ncbi:MAG: TetR/AcrR family transcriptional regulator [Lachnospiraceae bacterium]
MRIVKEHNERQNEILDTAQRLFAEKGYEKCTVNDILNKVGIAKGTFYHYFNSKEEVLDGMINRAAKQIFERTQKAALNPLHSSQEKLMHIFLALRMNDESGTGIIEEMHRPENALMHQKSLTSIVALTVPVLAGVIEEGNEKGDFRCDYPEEYMQIFMTAAVMLLDEGIFELSPDRQQSTFRALIALLGKMLSIDDDQIWEIVMKYWMQPALEE